MNSPLENLPVELFRSIFIYLSPEDAASLSSTCHRLHEIVRDELVWQNYFFQRYKYFNRIVPFSNDHYLSEIAVQPIEPGEKSSWQDLFTSRAIQDKHIRRLLNEIVSCRKNRIYNVEMISSMYGLQAVDVLKSYFPCSTSNSIHCRRLTHEHYSLEIVRLIFREIGIGLLHEMKNRRDISTHGRSLLNALYIIQCFHPDGLLLSLNRLHTIGKEVLSNIDYDQANLTKKCEFILLAMQKEKFLPANGGSDYYDIENSFLFSAFSGKPTIPLTLVSIFCALAEECGLDAHPLGFPGEVMAQVHHPSDRSSSLIISVFEGKIMSLDEINARLADVLDMPLSQPIAPTPIRELVIRSARNMINCITKYSTSLLNSYGLYAAVCVLKILGGDAFPFAFDSMLNILKEHFPMDIRFFESLSTVPFETNADLHRVRNEDSNPSPIPPKQRSTSILKFRIGQIFQHTHHRYWGVIHGWDRTCTASTLWQMRMGISNLVRGPNQPFYHILATDSSRRYVAEDNMDVSVFESIQDIELKASIIEQLCNADGIGKYFQSFDSEKSQFLATEELSEEYPDQ